MNRRSFVKLSSAALFSSSCGIPLKAKANSAGYRALQQKLAADPLRPQFHLLPQAGFIGDPCAPRIFNGQNHVFFHGSFGGRGWAHATSSDLVH